MVDNVVLKKLFEAFSKSYVTRIFEFVAHEDANVYFRLEDCETEFDVQCKVLEWLSRSAYKETPFRNEKRNAEFHSYMLNGINKFLGTNFGAEEIAVVYRELGNRVDHPLTVEFVSSGFDMSVLKGGAE